MGGGSVWLEESPWTHTLVWVARSVLLNWFFLETTSFGFLLSVFVSTGLASTFTSSVVSWTYKSGEEWMSKMCGVSAAPSTHTKIQKYKIQKYKNTKIQKYKNIKMQKYKNTKIKKYKKYIKTGVHENLF